MGKELREADLVIAPEQDGGAVDAAVTGTEPGTPRGRRAGAQKGRPGQKGQAQAGKAGRGQGRGQGQAKARWPGQAKAQGQAEDTQIDKPAQDRAKLRAGKGKPGQPGKAPTVLDLPAAAPVAEGAVAGPAPAGKPAMVKAKADPNGPMKLRELVDAIAAETKKRPSEIRPTLEAALRVLAREMGAGRSADLHPLGKVIVEGIKPRKGVRVLKTKIRQKVAKEIDGKSKEPLADPEKDR